MLNKSMDIQNIILLTFLPLVPNDETNQRILVGSKNKKMYIIDVGKLTFLLELCKTEI